MARFKYENNNFTYIQILVIWNSYRLREGLNSSGLFNLYYKPELLNPGRRLYLVPKQQLDHEVAPRHFLQVIAEERQSAPLPPGTAPQNVLNVTIFVSAT